MHPILNVIRHAIENRRIVTIHVVGTEKFETLMHDEMWIEDDLLFVQRRQKWTGMDVNKIQCYPLAVICPQHISGVGIATENSLATEEGQSYFSPSYVTSQALKNYEDEFDEKGFRKVRWEA